jgi:hypothetical protein
MSGHAIGNLGGSVGERRIEDVARRRASES